MKTLTNLKSGANNVISAAVAVRAWEGVVPFAALRGCFAIHADAVRAATAGRGVQGRVVKSDLSPVPFPPSSSLPKSGRSAQDDGKGCLRTDMTPSPLGEGWGGVVVRVDAEYFG